MNSQPAPQRPGLAYTAAVLGSFLIVAALVWAMRYYTQPAPLGEDRAAVRAKALAELRAADADTLDNAAWIDQGKGVVRLPIEDAIKLVVRGWQNPPAARSNLIAREEKVNPPPAPPAPSKFE
jgi:hypothetical protein